MAERAKVRLYVDAALGPEQCVSLTEAQAHYLFGVMRMAEGAALELFNGRDGAWTAEVAEAGRRRGTLVCRAQAAPLRLPPDVWLLFAPLRKARTDFIVEKAAELGVRRILPVATAFTGAERINRDRLQAHAVEAAEQCGATFVPEVAALQGLDAVLAGWDPARRILWGDEALAEAAREEGFPAAAQPEAGAGGSSAGPGAVRGAPWAILVGPEGGFSAEERARLRALPFVVPVRLGPRILRADTAAVAALTRWQLTWGDWR